MKYTKLFNTTTERDSYVNGNEYIQPYASLTIQDYTVQYNTNIDYMYFECGGQTQSFTIKLNDKHPLVSDENVQIEWSYDKNVWEELTSDEYVIVNWNQVIYLKGYNPNGLDGLVYRDGTVVGVEPLFSIDDDVICNGNIMSLILDTNHQNNDFQLPEYCFAGLFSGVDRLITPPNLPATSLGNNCYNRMFNECTYLTTAPKLPATTLAPGCYDRMFYRCTSLKTPPELPATTLQQSCYYGMFYGCTSLTTSPELPGTTLASYCYAQMFRGCTKLTTAPELPATTLQQNCYYQMFQDCSKLNYIKAMFTTTPGASYTSNWTYNVALSGTFVKNSEASWTTTGYDGIPSGWTVQTANA